MKISASMAERLNRAAFASCNDDENYKAGDEVSEAEIRKMFDAERIWEGATVEVEVVDG